MPLLPIAYSFEAVKKVIEDFDVKPGGMVQNFEIQSVSLQVEPS